MNSRKEYNLPILAILFSMLWWTYLGSLSQMLIVQDAVGYKHLAETILHQGLTGYFQTGPNREPLYSSLLAVSLQLEHSFHVSFTTVQVCFQLIILSITQLLLWKILKILQLRGFIQCLILLYFGLSPAINNAALSLFSEIGAFIFVLGIILASHRSFTLIDDPSSSNKQLMKTGLGLSLMFLGAVMVKAVFDVIFLFFVLYFIYVALRFKITQKNIQFKKTVILLLTIFLAFELPTLCFKLANQKFNGHFTLTDRGPWLLYGNMKRRTEKLDSQKWQTAFAYIPGLDFCELQFKSEECQFWSSQTSDMIGSQKRQELEQTLGSSASIDHEFLKASLQSFKERPWQASVLIFLEGLKMFFWETTHVGFVVYPDWLTHLYNNEWFNQTLKFLVALLTFASLIFSFLTLKSLSADSQRIIKACLLVLIPFALIHAIFLILPRYALPISSVYLILIGLMLERLTNFKKN